MLLQQIYTVSCKDAIFRIPHAYNNPTPLDSENLDHNWEDMNPDMNPATHHHWRHVVFVLKVISLEILQLQVDNGVVGFPVGFRFADIEYCIYYDYNINNDLLLCIPSIPI